MRSATDAFGAGALGDGAGGGAAFSDARRCMAAMRSATEGFLGSGAAPAVAAHTLLWKRTSRDPSTTLLM